jgi:bifunctional non-homologous end joining protein LigD
VVGSYEGKQLRYPGKSALGSPPHVRREVYIALKPLHSRTCLFVDLPNSKTSHGGRRRCRGVDAGASRLGRKIVAQMRPVEWTAQGHLRHAAFLGLRIEKRPTGIRGRADCLI